MRNHWLLLALLVQVSAGLGHAAAPSLSIARVNLPTSPPAGPSTYVSTYVSAMTADSQGNIFLAGVAFSGFPATPGAAQVQPGGGTCTILVPSLFFSIPRQLPCPDAFVAKVRISGNTSTILWATLVGGDTYEAASGIALDAAGNVYITGTTGGDFPTTPGAFMASGGSGVFAAKLNPQGSRMLYSTYLPAGTERPLAPAIAADPDGNAYVTVESPGVHVSVEKLSPDGSSLLYNQTLAGSATETDTAIAADAAGNVYVTGSTYSPDFPVTAGAFQTRLTGAQSAFVTKLDPSGNIAVSTYLGDNMYPSVIEADAAGYIYLAGGTGSLDMPTAQGSWEPEALIPMWSEELGGPGGFAARLSAAGDKLAYSTYVVSDGAGVRAMALDGAGGAYVAGATSAGLPVTGSAPQPCFTGNQNLFVAHLDPGGALLDRTYAGDPDAGPVPVGLAAVGGSIVLAANYSTGQSVLADLSFGSAGYVPAACLSPDVLNAATFFGQRPISPGELVSLTGIGLGPESGVSYQPAADGSVPRELAGVKVLFNGEPAPLLYVQSQQINAIAPFELAGQSSTTVQVQYKGGQHEFGDRPGWRRQSRHFPSRSRHIDAVRDSEPRWNSQQPGASGHGWFGDLGLRHGLRTDRSSRPDRRSLSARTRTAPDGRVPSAVCFGRRRVRRHPVCGSRAWTTRRSQSDQRACADAGEA